MKGNIRAVMALLSTAGVIGSIATYKVATIVFSGAHSTSIAYHLDERLSEEAQQHIITYIEDNKSIAPQALVDAVRSHFECVDTVQLSYAPFGVDLHISARDLSAIVNDQFVVTTSGAVLEKEHFAAPVFDELKYMNIHNAENDGASSMPNGVIPAAIQSWIERTPAHLFKLFDITWFDENHIELKNKKDLQLIIRCAHTQPIEALYVDACAQAKEALVKDNVFRGHQDLIADVRFDRQIIISKR